MIGPRRLAIQPLSDDRRAECRAVQAVLLDVSERRGVSANVQAAIDHVERCRDCERELAATALVLTALRRLGDDIRSADPPDDSWRAVAARIAGIRGDAAPARRRQLPGTVAGLLAGLALVVIVTVPSLVPPRSPIATASLSNSATDTAPRSVGRGLQLPHPAIDLDVRDPQLDPGGSVPARYPDNTKPAADSASAAQPNQ